MDFQKFVIVHKKKELLVKTRRHLDFVYVSIYSVSGIIFFDFVANSVINFFPTDQLTPTSQILSLSWYLLVQLLHLPLKCHLSKLSRNEKPFESGPKTVNIQGYSEVREPTRTRENSYSLIW